MLLPGLREDDCLTVVLPPELAGARALLTAEVGEFETALGVKVRLAAADPGTGPRWLMRLRPVAPPRLTWDEAHQLLLSTAADAAGLFAALNLLHTVIRTGGAAAHDTPAAGRDELIDRIAREIGGSFPDLVGRGIDWPAICGRHEDPVRAAADPASAVPWPQMSDVSVLLPYTL